MPTAGGGIQLRRHPVAWREVSTLEASRLLLLDMGADEQGVMKPLAQWQNIGDAAAKRALGPIRTAPQLSAEEIARSSAVAARSHEKRAKAKELYREKAKRGGVSGAS